MAPDRSSSPHHLAADFEGAERRVVSADYLATIALGAGRPKDQGILALLESGSVDPAALENLAARHGLADAWLRFRVRFIDV